MAANAMAFITNNGPSIHGNVVGIDVDGGTATITGNHIYGNTSAGVRIANAGTATVNSNNFDGPTPDNATDIRLESSATPGGGITGGAVTGNTFAGDTFFIDNLSTQNIDATSGNTFEGLNNFRIEDKMHHKVDTDNTGAGVITWVANNLYVTNPAVADLDRFVDPAGHQRGLDGQHRQC